MHREAVSDDMSNENLFTGKLVKLTAAEPGDHEIMARWSNDPIFMQRAYSGPAYPIPANQYLEWDKNFSCNGANEAEFRVRTVEDSRLVGSVKLHSISWTDRKASLSIAIGDEADRGKGYGSEAIRLILRYAFEELNLNRVSLWVFEYNHRAMKLYEKVGFKHEGRSRQNTFHQGRYWDSIQMSMLREEWQGLQADVDWWKDPNKTAEYYRRTHLKCKCDPAKGEACTNCPPIKIRNYSYGQCGCDPEYKTKCLYHYLGLDKFPSAFFNFNGEDYRQNCPYCFLPMTPYKPHFCSLAKPL